MANLSIEELANLAAQSEDQTETKAGGDFEYTPPPAGLGVGRFIEYIELGKQKQKPYQGKPKADAEMVRLTFELLSQKNIREIEVNGEKKTVADRISITINKNFGEKAKFKKLFNKMVYGRDGIKHFAQMLGEAFLITIQHNKSEDGKKVYANINDSEGNYTIGAPRQQVKEADPLAGTAAEYADISSKVRQPLSELKVFLWDHATKEQWDSIFIDGDRTTKDDKGNEVKESRNWLQAMIKSATNFGGSPISVVLSGIDTADLPTTEEQAKQDEPPFEPDNKPDANAALAELDKQKAPATTAADDLGALGL